MVAIVLLASAGTIIGIRLGKALDEKQFRTAADRLHAELEASRRLALNMQADYSIVLEKTNDSFILHRSCPEVAQSITMHWKALSRIQWNREPIEKIAFLFTATGKVEPKGVLEIIGSHQSVSWSFPELFAITETSEGTLRRPD